MTTTEPNPWLFAADLLSPPGDTFTPLPHQVPPDLPWFAWLLLGGRGSGKTAAAARYVHNHVHGPPCIAGIPGGHWISIVAPTLGDAVTSCIESPAGLRLHDPGIRTRAVPGGLIATWSNGAQAKIFGAHTPDDVERFRAGGNRCLVWAEEMAAWRYLDEAWQQIRYGLRSGPRPHAVITTTPRNRPLIKALVKDKRVKVTTATTDDNPHLPDDIKEMLFEDYGGTRLGQQELYAKILEDVDGALWKAITIEMHRILTEEAPEFYHQIAIGVDPQLKGVEPDIIKAKHEMSDETGIVAVGTSKIWAIDHMPQGAPPELKKLAKNRTHGFVLSDRSGRYDPTEWAAQVIEEYYRIKANFVVAEINNGGAMVAANIHSLDPTIPVKTVSATRGKARRAEPISNMYQQGRMHHVGYFPILEDQMTSFNAADPDDTWSPDHMDAMVWAATQLMIVPAAMRRGHAKDNRMKGRR